MIVLRVVKPGVLSLLQDAGRFGHHAIGLTSGGPLDGEAFYWANRLCLNEFGATALEVAQGGVRMECLGETTMAVTGAPMPLRVNGRTKALWRSHKLQPGDMIELGHAAKGMRAYLAVSGGFKAEEFFGSTATVIREGIGNPLKAGQELCCGLANDEQWALPMEAVPRYSDSVSLRLIPGYQFEQFSRRAHNVLSGGSFTVSNRLDRMGCILKGNPVESPETEMLSEGISLGAVQVPPDGQLIILLNDRQTIGGYPKLGSVLSVDLWKLAQCPPESQVRFEMINLEAAQKIIKNALAKRESTRLKRCL